jgi:hypothetical protein
VAGNPENRLDKWYNAKIKETVIMLRLSVFCLRWVRRNPRKKISSTVQVHSVRRAVKKGGWKNPVRNRLQRGNRNMGSSMPNFFCRCGRT